MSVEVAYVDHRGAGCVRAFADSASTLAFLRRLRCPATVRLGDEIVGGCEWTDAADDRRIHWNWWLDTPAIDAQALRAKAAS